MADNVSITAGTGTTIRTDEVGTTQVQVVKIALGADGAEDNLVDSGQQLMAASVPVVIASNQSAVAVSGPLTDTQIRATALPVSVATIPSHAVTNAGTFATQVDGAALTALQLIDNMISGSEAQVDVITVPAPLSTTGGGTEATALRVTIATDSTGVVSIDDNGGAITVDGTVAVTNAGITTIAGAVAGTEMQVDVLTMPTVTVNAHAVTNAGTFATQVDGAALTALQLIDNMISGSEAQVDVITLPALAAGTNLIGKVQPLDAILEGGLTELVGINEQVDQNDYSGSIGVALAGTYSGEILSVALYATEDGTGAVQDSAGILYIFDADPSISSGDTSMTAAERVTVIGKIGIGAADWDTDANGGLAYVTTQPIPFHAVGTLYFVWKHLDATALNDGAGDDEQLEFNFWYRRDS